MPVDTAIPIPETSAQQAPRMDIHNPAHRRAFAAAVRKLAGAVSLSEGTDCYALTSLARAALYRLGVKARLRIGSAAWRVDGECPHGCMVHHPGLSPQVGAALGYHTWLSIDGHIFDVTTYQLPAKVAALDAIDGQTTPVSWSPDFLWAPESASRSLHAVERSFTSGVFHYQHDPALAEHITRGAQPVDDCFVFNLLFLFSAELQGVPLHVVGPASNQYH